MLLLLVFLVLRRARPAFDRRAAFFDTRFSAAWIAALAGALGASVWLGLFAFKHVDYSHELWWQFEIQGEASRFLRASVGAAHGPAAVRVCPLDRVCASRSARADDADLEDAGRAIAAQTSTYPVSGVSPRQGAAVQRRSHRVCHVRRAGAHVGRARRSGWTGRSAQRSAFAAFSSGATTLAACRSSTKSARPICIGMPTSA